MRRDVVLRIIHNILEDDPAKHITTDDAQKYLLSNLPHSLVRYGCDLRKDCLSQTGGLDCQRWNDVMSVERNIKTNFYKSGYHNGDERIVALLECPFEREFLEQFFPPFFIHPGFWLLIRLIFLFVLFRLFRLFVVNDENFFPAEMS